MKVPRCIGCPMRGYAERRPHSLLGRLWRWHTGWCPGWKAYQKWLATGQPHQAAPRSHSSGH